ncbi:DUF5348 domain-containing protein [Paenibacillus xylanexedens]|uniref:DUF5348 domain-containing protein n=1 Tax=Paenibacillus xylanexedens TaxID=528191 RepID=UPI0011A1E18A|nr:DUF5348 domain-containing protein [Paenibacillus xylanexedens]
MANSNHHNLVEEALALSLQIQKFQKKIQDAEDNWTEFYDREDPQDQYVRLTLGMAVDQMETMARKILQIDKDVVSEGYLTRNRNGRFELNGHELTSGYPIEYLDLDDPNCWRQSRIEHSGDYYVYGDKSLQLEGLRVRIK